MITTQVTANVQEEKIKEQEEKIYSIKWEDICSYCDAGIDIFNDKVVEYPIDPDTILLGISNPIKNCLSLLVSRQSHKFIYSSTIPHITTKKFSDTGELLNGIIMFQRGENNIVFSYTTYDNFKRIIVLFKKHEGHWYPSTINVGTPSDEVSLEEDEESPRDPREPITDIEKIRCHNVSKKFLTMAEECKCLGDLYVKLMDVLNQTIDPSYMLKTLKLYRRLAIKGK